MSDERIYQKELIISTAIAFFNDYGPLDAAAYIAETVFEGVLDARGEPYIGHLRRVSKGAAVRASAQDEDPQAAAIIGLLHDLIEDTDFTLDDLRKIGYDEHIIEGINAVTRIEGEPYFNEMVRVGTVSHAIADKRADLHDNMDLSRLKRIPTDDDIARTKKYFLADKYLEAVQKDEIAPGTCFEKWMNAQKPEMQSQEILEAHYRFADGLMCRNGLRLPKVFPVPNP